MRCAVGGKQRKLYPEVEQWRAAIHEKSWATWQKLPVTVRVWLSPDDIVNESFAAVYERLRAWDPKRGRLGTYLWHVLDNFHRDEYLKRYYSEKRCDREMVRVFNKTYRIVGSRLISINDVEAKALAAGEEFQFEKMFHLRISTEDDWLRCFVADAIVKLYCEASESLRQALIHWFLRHPKHFRTDNSLFLHNSREFRELCETYRIDVCDCRHLQRAPECLDRLSRKLLGVPHDLNNPYCEQGKRYAAPIRSI